jgi:hypothetical protein
MVQGIKERAMRHRRFGDPRREIGPRLRVIRPADGCVAEAVCLPIRCFHAA